MFGYRLERERQTAKAQISLLAKADSKGPDQPLGRQQRPRSTFGQRQIAKAQIKLWADSKGPDQPLGKGRQQRPISLWAKVDSERPDQPLGKGGQ